MNKSETIDKLAAALAKFQGEVGEIKKDKTVNSGSFSYKYAELSSIIEATKKPLSANGLAVSQLTDLFEGKFILRTILIHSSGQFLEAQYPLPLNVTPQQTGSALTYGRRYSFCAITGIAAEEDDDGKSASEVKPLKEEAKVTKGKGVPSDSGPTPAQLKRLFAICGEHGWKTEDLKEYILKKYQIDSTKLLTKIQYEWLTGVIVPQMTPAEALKGLN